MAAISWAFGVSGDWSNAIYWSGGVVPGAGDDVSIDASGTYTVTLSTNDAAHSLVLNDAGATVALNSGGVLTLGSTLILTAGTFLVYGGVINGGTLSATGGTFNLESATLNGVTYDGVLGISSGSGIFVGANGLVVKGANGTGDGTIVNSGLLAFEQFQTFDHATIDLDGGAILAGHQQASGVSLTLGAHVIIDQTGKGAGISGYDMQTIVNEGTINADYDGGSFQIGGGEDHSFYANFANSGTILVKSEFMEINCYTFSNSGGITIENGGTLYAADGSVVNSGTITLGRNSAFTQYTGYFNNSGVITAGAGSKVSFGFGITNAGTISAIGASIGLPGDMLSARTVIENSKLGLSGTFSSANLAFVKNQGDTITIGGTLDNQGTLSIGAGSGFGTLTLDEARIKGGVIADSGAGLVLERAELDQVVYQGALDVAAAYSYLKFGPDGVVFEGAGGVGPGTITVTGDDTRFVFGASANTLDNATINLSGGQASFYVEQSGGNHGNLALGPGLIINEIEGLGGIGGPGGGASNEGVIEATGPGAQFDISVDYFTNAGVLRASGGGTIDLGSGARIGSEITGGTYEVDADSTLTISSAPSITTDGAIVILSGAGSAFLSHGALETTLATIASGGVLELLAGRGWSSTLAMSNAGILDLGGGVFAPASLTNTSIVSGYGVLATTVNNTNGELSVQAGETLSLVGGTLTDLTSTTLSGGIYLVGDGGLLQLANDTSIVTLDAVLVLNGAGSVQGFDTMTGSEVGLKSSLATIGASGVLEILGTRDFNSANGIGNMGVLRLGGAKLSGGELTDASGSSLTGFGAIVSVFADSGAVASSGGALAFSGPGDVFDGALGGQEIDFTGGTDLLAGGSGLTAGAVALSGGAVVTVDPALTFAGTLSETSATLTLAGKTLTLSGMATLGSKAVVNGTGKLAISAGGTVVGSAGTGKAVVALAITDAGLIEAATGTLDLSQALIGAGAMKIEAGATLEVDGAAARSLTTTFAGSGATLSLGSVAKFASVIAGFASGDVVELIKTAATAATLESGDRLLITNGMQTVATLKLSGSYEGDTFAVKMDQAGDARITLLGGGDASPPPPAGNAPPPPPGAGLFSQQMAALVAGAGLVSSPVVPSEGGRALFAGLAHPAIA